MEKIINYLNSYPKYTLVLVLTFVVCFIIIALIAIFYKKSKTIKSNDLQKNQENEQNSSNLGNVDNKNQSQATNFLQNNSALNEQPILDKEQTPAQKSDAIQPQSEPVSEPTSEPTKEENSTENNPKEKGKKVEEKIEKAEPNSQNKTKNSTKKAVETKQTNKTTVQNSEQIQEKTTTDTIEENTTTRYNGKWIIYQSEERYFADLKASNGELMLRTESYSTLSGIKSGIETLKKNIEAENFAISLDKNGNFVFKIFSTSKRLLCVGEGYSTREQCEKAFGSVKRFSKTAKIIVYREND